MTVAARLLAILEAETSQFDARFTASAVVVDKMTRSQTVAHRATTQMRAGLQELSMTAFAGAGPLGKLASGIAEIAGGWAALVGGGIGGAVFMWFDHLTKQLKEATDRADELGGTVRRMAAERLGSPLLRALSESEPFQKQAEDIQDQINQRLRSVPVGGTLSKEALIAADPLLSQLQRQLNDINKIIEEIGRKPESVLVGLRHELTLIPLELDDSLRLQAQWLGLVGKTADEFVRLSTALAIEPVQREGIRIQQDINDFLFGNAAKGIAPFALSPDIAPFVSLAKAQSAHDINVKPALEDAAGLRRGLSKNDLSNDIVNQLVAQEQQRLAILDLMNNKTFMANLAAEGLTDEFNAMVRAMNKTEIKAQQLAVALVSAVTGAISAIASGGGPGSFLSGAGGILSAMATKHPSLLLPGVILTGFGNIFSQFDRNEERRNQRLIQAVQDSLRPLVGPERITDLTANSRGRDLSRHDSMRDEMRDAVERSSGGR